jgi:hypothetical protein
MFWNRNHVQEQRQVARPSFRPVLEQLESRQLLSASPPGQDVMVQQLLDMNLTADAIRLSFDISTQTNQKTQGALIQAIGSSTGNKTLQQMGNQITAQATNTINQEVKTVQKDVKSLTDRLTASASIPPAERIAEDLGLLFLGGYMTVVGAVTQQSSLRKVGLDLANRASNDISAAINQAISNTFSLSSPSAPQGADPDNDNDVDMY